MAHVSVGTAGPDPQEQDPEALPAVLKSVYSSSVFLSSLSLYAGQRVGDGLDRWSTLPDWWQRSRGARTPNIVAIRKRVLDNAPEIARDVETLRTWTPPKPPLPGTVYASVYSKLAERYVARRGEVAVRRAAPGPLTGNRHPGFDFRYDAHRGVFEAAERRSPLHLEPSRFSFSLPLASRAQPRFDETVLEAYGAADAWELFALRAVLIALHGRTEDVALALERELGRPVWDHVLEQLSTKAEKPPEELEWCYAISSTYRDGEYKLLAYSRRDSLRGKPTRWKKTTFESLYLEESPIEREIARVALCLMDRPTEARLRLGTPQGHELLRVLAAHPRVRFVAGSASTDPDGETPAEIVVGDLAMHMERDETGVLTARFRIGEREVDPAILRDASSPGLRAGSRGGLIASAFVPPALRPWLSAAQSMGAALAFPQEAVTKLVSSTQALVASGAAILPRDALGTELPYEPAPALRVEWHPEGAAAIHVFITVHPRAPMVAPGKGPKLFTFDDGDQRVFVEREVAREIMIAEEACSQIAAPIIWEHAAGRTEGLQDSLALAEYLDRNPLGLAIEVKVGHAPKVTAWEDAKRDLNVKKDGAWLVLDGALDVAGVKLTLGDVLDAARLARRYVRVTDGVFLELSKEAIERLRPVAMAAELGEAGPGQDPRLNAAFGSILAEARSVFGTVGGVDLEALVERFESRTKRPRVAKLEQGTLRPYQQDGVAWMLQLASWAPGCILADDMGLGKTVQTAAVLKARAKSGPQLIIAPASVSSNWMAELQRFVPSLKTRWYNDDREIVPGALAAGDVLVVSYGLLQRRSDQFLGMRWTTIVVDEAQYVKNVAAQRTDIVRSLERDFTIALTGTPLENHLGELFSIVDLAFPGLLGSEPTFRERFRKPIEGQRDAVRLSVLARLLEPFLLRRTRATVLEELPPREEITEYIDLDANEQKRYLALRRVCEQQFAKRKASETAAQLKIALLAALTRLRQLACDVSLVDPEYTGPSTKITRAVEIAVELAQEGNRALVFSQFTQFLTKIRTALVAAGLRVAYLAGDTPTAKRKAIVDAFQAGEYDIFCVSLLAGGTGLNLTSASYVIHTDPWWNPAAEEQATSRAHRMGQTDPVTVYRLVARGTIEEAVLQMHASKKELASAVLEGKATGKVVTSQELLDLLHFEG